MKLRFIVSICIAVLLYPALFGQTAEEEVIKLKQQTQAVLDEETLVDEDRRVMVGTGFLLLQIL